MRGGRCRGLCAPDAVILAAPPWPELRAQQLPMCVAFLRHPPSEGLQDAGPFPAVQGLPAAGTPGASQPRSWAALQGSASFWLRVFMLLKTCDQNSFPFFLLAGNFMWVCKSVWKSVPFAGRWSRLRSAAPALLALRLFPALEVGAALILGCCLCCPSAPSFPGRLEQCPSTPDEP